MRHLVFTILFALLTATNALAREEVVLTAKDGLAFTADVYRLHEAPASPWIVLAHQAGASRGEYRDIAPRLNKLGFSAIALDQRSGRAFAGVANTAVASARKQKKRQGYFATRPDIEAGIAWARRQTTGKVILWGSSYSAALALLIAGEKPQLVDGVVANSPGEYLRGKTIWKAARDITVPVLITSPARERKRWRKIFQKIPVDTKVGYAPKSGGVHGSSAFIQDRNSSAEAYWDVAQDFLADNFAVRN